MRNLTKWRRGLLSLLLFTFAYFSIYAQQKTVTGQVTSEAEGPLPGVNIVVQGTVQGAVTDMDGNFSIEVPGPEAVLVFSYIGYSTIAVPVGDQMVINTVLKPDITALDEIVVTGYTAVRRGDITGAVAVEAVDVAVGHREDAVEGDERRRRRWRWRRR